MISICVLTIILMVSALIYFMSSQGGEHYTYAGKNGVSFTSISPTPEKDKNVRENENNAQQIRYKKEREGMGKLLFLYSIFR